MDQRPTKTPEPPSTPVVISADGEDGSDDFSWGRTPGADCLWCGDTCCTGAERDTHDRNLAGSEQRWRELAGGAA